MKLIAYILCFLCCCAFGQDEIYGVISMADKRDGQRYAAIRIGDYIWMTKNLNYDPGLFHNSWCYDCKKYGRLYDWDAAKKACPDGWHLPSRMEWNNLIKVAGLAGRLRAARWNNGGDDFEFSALPGGYLFSSGLMGSDHIHVGTNGYWWTATEDGDGNAIVKYIGSDYDEILEFSPRKTQGFSVRCVRNRN